MTLVDTGPLIAYVRTGEAKLLGLFQSLPGAICGVTRAEILHGAKTPADRGRLIGLLGSFHQVAIPDNLWDEIGDLLALLRRNGIIVPFNDAAIAAVAISTGLELWTYDGHFALIQGVEPRLKLFSESP